MLGRQSMEFGEMARWVYHVDENHDLHEVFVSSVWEIDTG